jgi:hypothetical protein
MKGACFLIVCGAALVGLAGCGENLAPGSADLTSYMPENLAAVSLDSASVGLRWEKSARLADTLLAGSIVQYGAVRDTVSPTVTSYAATGLASGGMTFSVSALTRDARKSSPVSIEWAPAKRFAGAFRLIEYNVAHYDSISALHCGSRTTNAFSLPIAAGNQPVLDLYIEGISGDNLRLKSASRFSQNWRVTPISSVTDSAGSLDFYRKTFPGADTFSQTEIQIQDNHIYYVLVQGDNAGEWQYARLHVRFLGGTFPNRTVLVGVSLQRIAGVPFACGDSPGGGPPMVANDHVS